MRSKTLNLIDKFTRQINEQGEDPNMQMDQNQGQSPDVTKNPAPAPDPQQAMPMTSEGENEYIAELIDAALFEPSAEEAQTLLNLQSVMKLKRYKNAREEVLPIILGIIRPSTESKDLKSELNSLTR